jgi:molybdate transport system ATP-binding protein
MNGITARFSATLGEFSLDVDLKLPSHGVIALFGHSGSGKTTLLRAIAGLERCTGTLTINGEKWQDENVFLPVHQRPIGYVFQEASLFPHLSVAKNLDFGWQRIPESARQIKREQVIDWLGIDHLLSRGVQRLSGGERQRVAIGRALLTSPKLLLMDEPLSALDEKSKQEILPYLERLHDELAIPMLYVSHSIAEVSRLADHIVQMEQGRVVDQGQAVELLSSLHQHFVPGEEPGAVIEASIAAHDDDHHLTTLALPGGLEITAPRLAATVGARARIRIPAREVSIALNVPQGTSILNILPAKIMAHSEGDPGRVLVQLCLEGSETRLLSRISRYSWERLELRNGMAVQAQIKSMSLAQSPG